MTQNFRDNKLLIAGGANGLGKEMVIYFASIMKEVIFIDNKVKEGKFLEKNLTSKGYKVKFYYCDLSNLNNASSVFNKIFSKHKKISFLINNAKCSNKSNFEKENIKSWIKSINVGLSSMFLLIQKFIKQKKIKNEVKSIINITSLLVDLIDHNPPSYHIAKSGLAKLTEYYAVHAAKKYNFRINNISPGNLVQKRYLKKFNSKKNLKYKKKYLSTVPLGIYLNENDIIKTIEFLFSNNSNFYNGETFNLHGGSSLIANTMFLKK